MQIKTLEESEEAYLRQAELVKHLQAENSALQHDARDIDSLRLEIEQLQRQVFVLPPPCSLPNHFREGCIQRIRCATQCRS